MKAIPSNLHQEANGLASILSDSSSTVKPLQTIIGNASKVPGKENAAPGTFRAPSNFVPARIGSNDIFDGQQHSLFFEPTLEMILGPLQSQLEAVALRQDGMESRLQNLETRFARMETRQMSLECTNCRTDAELRSMDHFHCVLDSQVQTLATRQACTEDSQRNMVIRLHNMEARQANFCASQMTDPLFELWNLQLEVPKSCFPSTLGAALRMSEKDMSSFVDHYNLLLPAVPLSLKERRLAIHRFIGIRPALSRRIPY